MSDWILKVDGPELDNRLDKILTLLQNVSDIQQDIVTINTLSQSNDSRFTAIENAVSAISTEFANHVDTDLNRWQQFSDLKLKVTEMNAGIQNKKLDTTNEVDIESQAQTSTGYTVSNVLGGVVSFNAVNVLLSFGNLYVNGVNVWSSAGLSLSLAGITDSYEVQDGDVITCTGMSWIKFTPYISA